MSIGKLVGIVLAAIASSGGTKPAASYRLPELTVRPADGLVDQPYQVLVTGAAPGARAITSALVPVPVLPQFLFPISYYYHVEARRCGIVREAIDWLKEAFDPKSYPWFADTFVHPEDFPHAQVRQARVVSMFQHFMDHVVR